MFAGRRKLLAAFILAALVAGVASAQFRRGFGYRVKMMTPEDYNGAFLFCRIAFRNSPYGDGGGWSVDYPRADVNLTFRLSELTKTPVTRHPQEDYNHVVLQLTDPLLYRCPFIMMTEPGGAFLDEAEAAQLHDYGLKGGFLWADDFWGERAFEWWAGQIGKAFPPEHYPIVDLPLEHKLFHVLYDVKAIPQIPSINFWYGTGGRTSERGSDSAEPHVRAVSDRDGRVLVVMTHNTDFGDAFEREGESREYFERFAGAGYAFGIDTLLYSMTH